MFYFITTITTALALSAIGAYFSIIGLATIFPGGEKSVIVMASILEVAKIVTVIWLHRNWFKCKILLKSYLTFAVLTLMGITSLGIFGFLSKSHVEHQLVTEKEMALAEEFDVKIKREEDLVKQYESYIKLDVYKEDGSSNKFKYRKIEIQESIKKLKNKFDQDIDFENKKIQEYNLSLQKLNEEREKVLNSPKSFFSNHEKDLEKIESSQKEDRENIKNNILNIKNKIQEIKDTYDKNYQKLNQDIEEISKIEWNNLDQKKIDNDKYNLLINKSINNIQDLKQQKIKFQEKIIALETEIGPLKYVVGLLNDISKENIENDQAVRLVIVIIMIVFDPLAILLLVAAQVSYKKDRGEFVNKTYVDLHKKINKRD